MRTVEQRLKFIEDSLLELADFMEYVSMHVDASNHYYVDPYTSAVQDLVHSIRTTLRVSTFDDEE